MDYDDDAIGYPMTHEDHLRWSDDELAICGQYGEDIYLTTGNVYVQPIEDDIPY